MGRLYRTDVWRYKSVGFPPGCADSRTNVHAAPERPSIVAVSTYPNRPDPTIYVRLSAAVSDATYDLCQKKTTVEIAVIRTGVAVAEAVIDANRDDRSR